MKLTAPAMFLLIVASARAQTLPNPFPGYRPLEQLQQFLQLTDTQVQAILTNNGDYNQFAMTKQTRISQLQSEIATETAKETLEPMALGLRYAEIETICREMKNQAVTYQTKNTAVLTEPQKAKLQVLQEAVKLAPVISDAQSGNLIGTFNYAPLFFTSGSGGSASGSLIGGMMFPMSGCSSPVPTAVFRGGDFADTRSNAAATPNKWFNTTGFVTPAAAGNRK